MLASKAVEQRLKFTLALVQQVGKLVLDYFGQENLSIENKENGTPVSVADKLAEKMIREAIENSYPGESILGEEQGISGESKDIRWIVDPIDGTESFIRGVPLFGTLIGLEVEGKVQMGVASLPALNEVYYACAGLGAWRKQASQEPKQIFVSKTKNLNEAMFSTSSESYFSAVEKQAMYYQFINQTKDSRGWSDCYGHLLVASGSIDIMADAVMHPWDCAALKPIVEEAGGVFVSFAGEDNIYSGSAISTNKNLLQAALAITNNSAKEVSVSSSKAARASQ